MNNKLRIWAMAPFIFRSYLDPVELMLWLLLALSESPLLTTLLPASEKFLSL
jgi:hypothetical protein